MQKKFKINISYDGKYIQGWEGIGEFSYLKDILQKAIFCFSNQNVNIICAARTDKGVHAEDNVCSFELDTSFSLYKLQHAINYFLPNFIRVLLVEQVSENFDARFSALYRHYKYLVSFGKKRPLLQDKVLFTNLKYFNQITSFEKILVGQHNFTSFCPTKTLGKKIRIIDQFYFREISIFASPICEINVIAKSFLHRQVRNLIGSLIDLEKGHLSFNHILDSLKNGTRIPINTAPALGLYLHKVLY